MQPNLTLRGRETNIYSVHIWQTGFLPPREDTFVA